MRVEFADIISSKLSSSSLTMEGAYRTVNLLATYPQSDSGIGISTKFSLLHKISVSAILPLATTKAAMQTTAGMAALATEGGLSRHSFLRLLFALDDVEHHGQKTLPRSMYVPSRAHLGGSKSPRLSSALLSITASQTVAG